MQQRDQDLRDRDPEVEADLPDHLQRDDRRGEVQPRVAQLRQQHRIGAAADRRASAARRSRCGVRAHRGDHGSRVSAVYDRRDASRDQRARAIVDLVVSRGVRRRSRCSSPTTHGELVAAATMDGAAPDTRLNAQRKAYTAARSDARTTRELAEKVRDDPVERASFDPFFTFFLGGVAVFDGERRIGAVGVSGLPGEVDERLALARYRTIRGSLKTSSSSRLASRTRRRRRPSGPAWNQCSVSGGIVYWSPGRERDLVLAVDVEVHASARGSGTSPPCPGRRRPADGGARGRPGPGRARAPSRRPAPCSRRRRAAGRSPRAGRARSRRPRSRRARRASARCRPARASPRPARAPRRRSQRDRRAARRRLVQRLERARLARPRRRGRAAARPRRGSRRSGSRARGGTSRRARARSARPRRRGAARSPASSQCHGSSRKSEPSLPIASSSSRSGSAVPQSKIASTSPGKRSVAGRTPSRCRSGRTTPRRRPARARRRAAASR